MMISETVPAALDGERLDRAVALLADVSRAVSAALIAGGAVRVDGEAVRAGKSRVAAGSHVTIDTAAIPVASPPRADPSVAFGVVHADPEFVVVDKPAGLVVHPGAGNPGGTLVNGLLARFPDIAALGSGDTEGRPGIVHRLDAGSSGLLVVARTEAARASLLAQFAAHTATRRYVALVWGHPEAVHGIVDAPIGRDPGDPTRMAVVAGGRPARTEYEVVERLHNGVDTALLTCQLETGRTHQIRVHLAAVGHPLVGDSTYGERRSTLGLDRPFLHAAELSFDDPTTGARVSFTSELPADLTALLERLRA
jgi:23S rRNA pseudouridine1911/1915/1917 synthase